MRIHRCRTMQSHYSLILPNQPPRQLTEQSFLTHLHAHEHESNQEKNKAPWTFDEGHNEPCHKSKFDDPINKYSLAVCRVLRHRDLNSYDQKIKKQIRHQWISIRIGLCVNECKDGQTYCPKIFNPNISKTRPPVSDLQIPDHHIPTKKKQNKSGDVGVAGKLYSGF